MRVPTWVSPMDKAFFLSSLFYALTPAPAPAQMQIINQVTGITVTSPVALPGQAVLISVRTVAGCSTGGRSELRRRFTDYLDTYPGMIPILSHKYNNTLTLAAAPSPAARAA
jgi:hypothetical protein